MRRIPGWVWAVGVTAGLAIHGPARAAGVWVTLAAGLPGAAAPTSESDLWFDSPHAPPFVAVTSAPGTVVAGTAGGTTSFGGLATPVLLNLGDGSAYLTGGSKAPDAALARGPKGGSAGPAASATPAGNATVPDTAALLGLKLADPAAAGARDLTAAFTDAGGKSLATGTVTVPDGGWWVIGLGPDATTTPPPPPVVDPPVVTPPVVDPPVVDPPVVTPPVVDPPTVPTDGPGPVATPEPSALALVAVGGVSATALRRLRARKSA